MVVKTIKTLKNGTVDQFRVSVGTFASHKQVSALGSSLELRDIPVVKLIQTTKGSCVISLAR